MLARQNGLTLNTVAQGAWSLLLSYYSGKRDLVFMSTVSGRPAELPWVMTTVGLFINALPVRVRVESDLSLTEWLRRIQDLHVQMRQFEYTPLTQILQWTKSNGGVQQFETLVIFENYPRQGLVGKWNDELKISDVGLYEKNNYPMTLVVGPGEDDTALIIGYDSSRYDPGDVEKISERLRNLLTGFTLNPNGTVSSFTMGSERERKQAITEFNTALE